MAYSLFTIDGIQEYTVASFVKGSRTISVSCSIYWMLCFSIFFISFLLTLIMGTQKGDFFKGFQVNYHKRKERYGFDKETLTLNHSALIHGHLLISGTTDHVIQFGGRIVQPLNTDAGGMLGVILIIRASMNMAVHIEVRRGVVEISGRLMHENNMLVIDHGILGNILEADLSPPVGGPSSIMIAHYENLIAVQPMHQLAHLFFAAEANIAQNEYLIILGNNLVPAVDQAPVHGVCVEPGAVLILDDIFVAEVKIGANKSFFHLAIFLFIFYNIGKPPGGRLLT